MTTDASSRRLANNDFFVLVWLHISLILLGTAAIFTPTLVNLGVSIQMDAGDSLLNLLFLENGYLHLWGGEDWLSFNEWCNPGFFYPYPNVLAWSDHAFIPSALYGVLRHFLGPIGAYGLWMILTAAINFLVFSTILMRFVRPCTALAIAFVTSYGVAQLSQLGHSQLLTQWFIPPCLICISEVAILIQETIRRRTNRNFPQLAAKSIHGGLLLVATFLCSYYLFYMLLLASVFVFGASTFAYFIRTDPSQFAQKDGRLRSSQIWAARPLGIRDSRHGNWLVVQVSLLVALLVPSIKIGWAYFDSYRLHGGRPLSLYPFERPDSFQPWLTTTFQSGDLFLPPPVMVEALRGDVTNLAENGLFNGYVYLVCFFLGLAIVLQGYLKILVGSPLSWQVQKPAHLHMGWLLPEQLLAGSLIFFTASIGVGLVIFEAHDFGLWSGLLSKLPGASAIRAVSRFGFIQLYLSSIAIAFSFEYYSQSFMQSTQVDRRSAWLSGIAVAIFFLNVMGSHPFANITSFFPVVRSIHSEATRQQCDVIYLHSGQFNPLLANALALEPAPHLKVINGYSGWPSPLVAKLDGIKMLGPNSLRNAVESERLTAAARSSPGFSKHLNYCHVTRTQNGGELIFEHL